jgi:hypothetical protein
VFFKWGWKISGKTCVKRSTFREEAGIQEEAGMSDEDRNKRMGTDEDGGDVEAHVKGGRGAADDDTAGDDVEAHVKGGREAVKGGRGADDDNSDDVEAHVKGGR